MPHKCGSFGRIQDKIWLTDARGRIRIEKIEFKGEDAFSYYNYAKLFFLINNMPEFNDISDGFTRRVILVDFRKQFLEEKKDKDFGSRDTREIKPSENLKIFIVFSTCL